MAKGGSWERDVCKFLSKWINGTEKPYVFWRGAGSGAVFTKNNLVGERFAGDVYHVREEGKFLTDKFVIECKCGYKEASFNKHLKYNKSDPIRDFWHQVINDALNTDKQPMLVFKKKGYTTPWVGISHSIFYKLEHNLLGVRFVHLRWDIELSDCYLFEYKEFFEKITPDIIKDI